MIHTNFDIVQFRLFVSMVHLGIINNPKTALLCISTFGSTTRYLFLRCIELNIIEKAYSKNKNRKFFEIL